MKIFVDLDDTLFNTKGMDYTNSTPIEERISKINDLYNQGHEITIYTARGSGTGINHFELTKNQLKKFGVKYHYLNIGNKPVFDLLIDDKAISDKEFFND
jgi:hypothetical protein